MSKTFGLFQVYGIELEYMIVDAETLNVSPISDELLKKAFGSYVSDFEDGDITWSNELVTHVIELKTTGPAKSLVNLDTEFHRSIRKVNDLLKSFGARLMPSAMHPWMEPMRETRLWPHDNNEVYDAYNRIFDCRGHGWSNLQSMHINLPFSNDEEFSRLHTAIRFLLPLLPALTASSPLLDGEMTNSKDNRLLCYQQNQKAVPSIAGDVIPEPVHSEAEYHEKILSRIYRDIAPHDPDQILQDDWLNSRGAIARFERKTIEIRVLDTQECPAADLAVAELISAVLKCLVSEELISKKTQLSFSNLELKKIFDDVAHQGESALITNLSYAATFPNRPDSKISHSAAGSTATQIPLPAMQIPNPSTTGTHDPHPPKKRSADNEIEPVTAQTIWRNILHLPQVKSKMSARHFETAGHLVAGGTLATRLQKALGKSPTHADIKKVYAQLCQCLETNELFIG
jgi:carboxylate-amine ligase